MAGEYVPLGREIAEWYVERFAGINDVASGDRDLERFDQAGIIMSALAQQGATERVTGFMRDLAPDSYYEVGAIAAALDYSDAEALPAMLEALGMTIDPNELALEERLMVLASVSKALTREPDAGARPWPDLSIDVDAIFEQVVSKRHVSPRIVDDLLQIGIFSTIPDSKRYAGYLVALIEHRVSTVQANLATDDVRGGVNLFFVQGALEGLATLGFSDLEGKLITTLLKDTAYYGTVATHFSDQLADNDKKEALRTLYEQVRPKLMGIEGDNADLEYATYVARRGEFDEALAFAGTLDNYSDRVQIMRNVSRRLALKNELARAREVLSEAVALDPLQVEPYANAESDDDFLRAAEDLLEDRARAFGDLAETAALLGDYDLAVSLYAEAHDSSTRTAPDMARYALRGRMNQYVRSILASGLDDERRAKLLNHAMVAFMGRRERLDDNGTGPVMEFEIHEQIRQYATTRMTLLIEAGQLGSEGEIAVASLLALCGEDGVLELHNAPDHRHAYRRLLTSVVQHKAYSGQTSEAMQLYDASFPEGEPLQSSHLALRAIISNGILFNDRAAATDALFRITPSERREAISLVLYEIGDIVYDAPDWAIGLAVDVERYDRRETNIRYMAQAITRFGLVTPQVPEVE